MTKNKSEEITDNFVFADMHRFLDDDVTEEERQSFSAKLGKSGKDILEKYRHNRGRMQLEFQAQMLSPRNQLKLRTFVEDQAIAANAETADISNFERIVSLKRLRNHGIFLLLMISLLYFGYSYLVPMTEEEFNAIEYLHFEALAMEQDQESRLDYPTSHFKEVLGYLSSYRGLNFSPVVFQDLPEGWSTIGASVIDYEVAKASVIQLARRDGDYFDSLFLFTYPGSGKALPKAVEGDLDGFKYKTFTTDELNMIVWTSGEAQMSMLIGRLSAPDLAFIGKQTEAIAR
jgi:hypothetical protein